MAEGFIPPVVRDLIALLSTVVAFLALYEVLQIQKRISNVVESSRGRKAPPFLPIAFVIVILAGHVVLVVIAAIHYFTIPFSLDREKYEALIGGTTFSFVVGISVGVLADIFSEGQVHWLTHATVILSALLVTYYLGIFVWQESHLLWIGVPHQLAKTALVSGTGMLGYMITSKPWDLLRNE